MRFVYKCFMASIYTASALKSILSSMPRAPLNSGLWRALTQAKISRVKPTRRGCRAGRRKNIALLTCEPALLHGSNRLGMIPTGCLGLQEQGNELFFDISLSGELNIQSNTSTSSSININILGYPCELTPELTSSCSTPRSRRLDVPGETPLNSSIDLLLSKERTTPRNIPRNNDVNRNRPNLVYIKRNQQQCLGPKKRLTFSNVNARSLRNKTEVFIDHVIDKKIDVCVVTETWLRDDDSVTLAALAPRGYLFRNIPRVGSVLQRSGGGTGLLYRENFKVSLAGKKQRKSFETSEWNLTAHARTTKFIIIYRRPYSEVHPVSPSVFFEEFAAYLEGIVLCHEVLVIAGDFNFHMDDLSDADARQFDALLQTFGLTQHVNFATHVSGHWLDLIITRSSNDVMVMSPHPSLFLSDHCFAECILAIPSPAIVVKELSYRRWKQIDLDAFKNDIVTSELYGLPANKLPASYDAVLRTILDSHAPLQHRVLVVRPKVPWFDDDLKQLKADRRKLEKRMRKSSSISDVLAYRKACSAYCALLKDAKKKYYCNLIQDCAGDSKKLFQVVSSLCKERSENSLPPHVNPRQLADDFGEFFCRKITLIKENINCCDTQPPDLQLPLPTGKLVNFATVSESDVREIITSGSNASCQLDPLPTWLVKKCVHELAPIITNMINWSLSNGCVPDEWKIALIRPLLKKLGLELIFINFRPVSNLPLVSKIAEKAVIPQLLGHCCEHAPLPTNQSSYRQHHSTETALLRVQNDILLNMDNQEVTLLILLDLSAAFDTIDHNIMADVLENDFGVTGVALGWLKSFLSGRKQRVCIDQHQSKYLDLTSGVPQGSCLGPVLFVMYASRLFHVVKKHLPTAQGYADDTQLYLSFRPGSSASQEEAVKAMEDCIEDVRSWMTTHQLMLNDNKTEFIILGSRQQLTKVNIDGINVGSSTIKPVSSVRNLGSWFDISMTMDTHIGKVCSKAFRGLYKIRQIRSFLTEDATKTLIHAFVSSHLDYCNSLLCGIPQYQLDRLQRVLNAAARVTCFVPRYSHITPVLEQLHWLPVRFRILFKVALLMFKVSKGMAPDYLIELFEIKGSSRYALRSSNQNLLVVPRSRCKTFGDRALSVAGPKTWNSLPLSVRNSDTVNCFKTRLKTFLFILAFKK